MSETYEVYIPGKKIWTSEVELLTYLKEQIPDINPSGKYAYAFYSNRDNRKRHYKPLKDAIGECRLDFHPIGSFNHSNALRELPIKRERTRDRDTRDSEKPPLAKSVQMLAEEVREMNVMLKEVLRILRDK